jgi:hypothetical protein
MRPCNQNPTVEGVKGPAYYLDPHGKIRRLTSSLLLSGDLRADTPIIYGAPTPPTVSDFLHDKPGLLRTTAAVAGVSLKCKRAVSSIESLEDRWSLERIAAGGTALTQLRATQRLRRLAAEDYRAELGLPELEPIRVASGTSLFRSGDTVIRVAAPNRSAMGSPQLAALAELYANRGIPTARSTNTPRETPQGDEMTFWEFVATDPSQPFPAREVGGILADLHRIPLPEAEQALGFPPPPLAAAVARGRKRVDALKQDPKGFEIDGDQLEEMFNSAERDFQEASSREDEVLLHGDLNPGNVLFGAGDVRLCDFEACTRGPWVWDLVNTQIAVAFGTEPASNMSDLVDGYGVDPKTSATWSSLCKLRALNIVTFKVFEAAAGSPAGADAAQWVAWMNGGFPGLPSDREAVSAA